MNKQHLHINLIKKIKLALSIFILITVMLMHINVIFSEYIPFLCEDLIELSEQGENENEKENEIKNEHSLYNVFEIKFSNSISNLLDIERYNRLQKHFIEIFSPPPEYMLAA